MRFVLGFGLAAVGFSTTLGCQAPEADDAEVGGTEGESGEAAGAESAATGTQFELEGSIEVLTHPAQPMVADLRVRTSEGLGPEVAELLSWSHQGDPGVAFVYLSSSDDLREHTFRARGLLPAAAHTVQVEATTASGQQVLSTDFTTLAPLPGFQAQLPVQGQAIAGDFRLLDWSSLDQRPGGIMQIDPTGRTRWYYGREWSSDLNSLLTGVKLLADGSVGWLSNNQIVIRDELNELRWSLSAAQVGQSAFHHELVELPSGNFMTMGYSFMIENYDPGGDLLIAGDLLLEYDLDGELVWSWDALEHLDTQRVREDFHNTIPPIIDPDSGEIAKDWSHGNGIEFRASDQLIVASFRHLDWVVGIDYPSGEVLWRLGEGGDFDLLEGSWFFHQHSPQWQPDGSLLLYDNGNGNPNLPGNTWRSRAVRYELDFDTWTATQVWEDDSLDVQSPAMSDADRTSAGSYLVTDSAIGLTNFFSEAHSVVRELDPSANPQESWRFETESGRIVYRSVPSSRWVGEATP